MRSTPLLAYDGVVGISTILVIRFQTITTNPIPVTCTNCYRNIWIYYLFKKKCMYKEKAIEEEYNPGSYGNFVGCRACSTTNYTNVISLNENTELGRLLNSMFTKYYPSSFVPLGLCPSCESTLKEIQVFRRVLSLANQYFEQHQENLLHSQVSQDKPVVALKEWYFSVASITSLLTGAFLQILNSLNNQSDALNDFK
ncbi:unnamed protein product [Acanthoscelides obtectus]|uniref:Uncharacterized protein n=1 Tax=Acanthoscelides obtectus TaxID=200917 RepID=A0A9P0Q1Z6_ACAOB|nr:unnamed protein product [Acanthoscelides obtectus]CAK1649209.1 hypothetical protein AOBTE_LOCUS16096 [Acanthoscelides obtectus]